jgi:hypothetical protein
MGVMTTGWPPFEPEVGEKFFLNYDGKWPSPTQELTQKWCVVDITHHNGYAINNAETRCIMARPADPNDRVGVGNYVALGHKDTRVLWAERCVHYTRVISTHFCSECLQEEAARTNPTKTSTNPPIKENKDMQIGSGHNSLWAGTLRVKGGVVPVIYNGDPDDGPDDSVIFWQGDLTKPYTDDEKPNGKVPEGWQSGWQKAKEIADEVIKTFLADGIEAAAKKVAK